MHNAFVTMHVFEGGAFQARFRLRQVLALPVWLHVPYVLRIRHLFYSIPKIR